MKVIPETEQDIVAIITTEFRSFGGGQPANGNPIAAALSDAAPVFAAGVSVSDVVQRVLELQAQWSLDHER